AGETREFRRVHPGESLSGGPAAVFSTLRFTTAEDRRGTIPVMTPPEVLRVEGLTKVYGRKRALDGISFSVTKGDVFGFLGPNGAGKTTTIRIVTGLIRATSGRVILFGEERRGAALPAMARMGAMVEIPRFYPHLSGRENLRALGLLSGLEDGEALSAALETVRLTEAADDTVRTYSQGMRQRLGIAQALIAEPELVLLDEPTNGLDPAGVHEIRQLISDLNRERAITFLISSHQLLEVEQLANRVAILRRGKVLVAGSVEEILSRETDRHRIGVDDPERARVVLEEDFEVEAGGRAALRVRVGREEVSGLVERLVASGIGVREVIPERPNLEDFFLRVTEGEEADLGR
ncbi:MAG: ABC transporter ATP-binding protein, partial [Planctomycetota bacterium]